MELGAVGLTVSTTAEAVAMAGVCKDLLLAYPVIDPVQVARLAELCGRVTLRVAVDSFMAAKRLSAAADEIGHTIHILVELDVGTRRTGTQSPELCADLACRVAELPGVVLDGIMIYPGQMPVSFAEDPEAAWAPIQSSLQSAIQLWHRYGLEPKIISGGSTPTAYHSHYLKDLTEIRPGTYVFNDLNTVHAGAASIGDCAASIQSTVVSDTVPGQVVIDAGSKTLSSDLCGPAPDSGHGYVIEYPEAVIARLYEEHGLVDVSRCRTTPKIGDTVTIIPNHICPSINLQSRLWLSEDDRDNAAPAPFLTEARR